MRIAGRSGFDPWHRAAVDFGRPRTNFYFVVRSPIANDSPEHTGPGRLLARMANDAFDELAYPAALAGQSCSLYRHRRSIAYHVP